jgi:hypothetical protein
MNDILTFAKNYKIENYPNRIRTVVEDCKLSSIIELSKSVQDLEGDVCEVGVWRGCVGVILGEIFKNKNIYLFDTFEGIPYADKNYDNVHVKGDFGSNPERPEGDIYKISSHYTDFCEVKETLSIYKNIFIYKGIFPLETSFNIYQNKFCFIHLDVDVYQSYKESLEFFYPRMVNKGLILLDDYGVSSCQGATIAVNNFCKDNNLNVDKHNDQFFIRVNN